MRQGFVTSVQGLNEFANVAKRKLGMSWAELHDALSFVRTLCQVIVPVDLEIHTKGLQLAEQHGFAVFDSLMIASALHAGCVTFWSEDMQDGRIVDARLRIANPFLKP